VQDFDKRSCRSCGRKAVLIELFHSVMKSAHDINGEEHGQWFMTVNGPARMQIKDHGNCAKIALGRALGYKRIPYARHERIHHE